MVGNYIWKNKLCLPLPNSLQKKSVSSGIGSDSNTGTCTAIAGNSKTQIFRLKKGVEL